MNTERCSIMVLVRGNSYNELRECWPLGLSISMVSVFKYLTCDIKGIIYRLYCGHCHPFNTASLGTIVLLVLSLYTFTFFCHRL